MTYMSGFRNSVFGWMSSLPELSDTFHQDHRHHEDQVIMTNANFLFLRLPDQTCSPGVLLTLFLHSHLGCYITGHPFLSPPSASKQDTQTQQWTKTYSLGGATQSKAFGNQRQQRFLLTIEQTPSLKFLATHSQLCPLQS
ncbi:uncharacterized protein LOC103164384 isoform X1 [Cricetulus griseus]|uniref:uncharacterized protein LOC103164384 isoform X1 n=1 Tax=Cricetulus griseus TaxID=10029 RepID=UPI0015C305EA|nr:uncharacterized protein LOC103164384 isoform X1 [Cricetulus griseus]